ncbi:hypothetical protein BC939DRAFT_450023 [Gamsiella multidivaricata]|uniref:uncharacterized protein n=1 Tax=Gamsiella multidivaricata TaxID=101098 RepID=UPI0022203777|nr:uncharacterized protein BC939DRAFT_450023 [Gamsiella multidivaricata]KAG0367502.1 hypothetical protein BGZ54_003762 [Gamsiella multidivaricata]KAI7824319.1 hypothetical protein BC939DRAFT_450023 [Gamsiella multidivaricata]
MFIKSAALTVLALAASVSAQTPNHTYFTNPVTDGLNYVAGQTATFSWALACVSPSTYTSTTPTQVPVQLLNSTNSNNAFYLADVTTIDCTKSQGNTQWSVPDKFGTSGLFSLKIVFDGGNAAYSGRFTISSKDAPATPSATAAPTATSKPSGANVLVPVLSGAAAIAAGALAFL